MHRPELIVPLVSYPDAGPSTTVMTAVAAARHLGADLVGLKLVADIPDVSSPLSRLLLDTPALIRKAEAESRKHAVELAVALANAAEAEGVAISIADVSVRPELFGEEAASRARYSDLTVVAWTAGNEAVASIAEAVLFGSGRPLLLAPAGSTLQSMDHVAIAWDGSRVAARALADARDFLARAARVSVVTIVDEKPLPSDDIGRKLADALERRGLEATAVTGTAEDCPIAETLQKDAAALGAGLLVMGGYGHSRLRDFVLGGATQGVLDNLTMPVLLSH
ncbi:MAG: universal stress protein [Rhizobiaceae bacterium]